MIIPILIAITLNLPRKGVKFDTISYKIFFIYFFFPTFFIILAMSLVEGVYLNKTFLTVDNFIFIKLFIYNIFINLINIT